MDQNDINIAMVTGNVSPLARFLLEAFERNVFWLLYEGHFTPKKRTGFSDF
jgi:hypothetical protein